MPRTTAKPATNDAVAWFDPVQAPLLRRIAEAASLRIVAAGGPPTAARSAPPPPFEHAETIDDLPRALAATEARVLLLGGAADPARVHADNPAEGPELLRLCRARSIRCLCIEPVPASLSEARAAEPPEWLAVCRPLSLFGASRAGRALSDMLQSFGPVRTVSASFRAAPSHGSLGARLFDAMHLLHTLLGPPESIDAGVVTRVASSGVRMAPGESLRTLHGDMTANLRYAGARAASVMLSDRAGAWFRGLTIVGEAGSIRLTDTDTERRDASGAPLEDAPHAARRARRAENQEDPGAAALADAAREALDPRAPRPAPFDLHAVMAACEAAILSARTGQPESPATVARMTA